MTEKRITEMKNLCTEMREKIITMIAYAGKGHPGGSLSAVEFLAACYFEEMNLRPEDPAWADRDRFVLSKGHASAAIYAALAIKGIISPEILDTYNRFGSILQGHPDSKKCPGIEISTGSLGQGFACAAGMALTGKLDRKDYVVYALCGDGECNEGEIWETCQSASKYHLDNLILMVDQNGFQGDGDVREIMPPLDLAKKFEAFGFDVQAIDGNDIDEVVEALKKARVKKNGKPQCVIGKTTKGKGVSFMENNPDWHGKAPNASQCKTALTEIRAHYIPAKETI